MRFSRCKASGTAPGGLGGEPRGKCRHRWAAQVGLGDASSSRRRQARSHCRYRAGIKPFSAKRLSSSELAPSYGKLRLEALQPSLLQRVTDNPAASQIPRDRPSSSPLGKDVSDPVPSWSSLSVPSFSQKKFLRSQKILPLCSQNIIIFSFLIKSHSPSALHTCFG